MTRGFAAGVVNAFLDTTFGTTYIQLHTADPGAAGAANISACDATRKVATMAAASGGSKAMTGTAGPWTNDGVPSSEIITDVSAWTASTAGTFNMSGQLTSAQTWNATNTFTLTALSFSITPIAA